MWSKARTERSRRAPLYSHANSSTCAFLLLGGGASAGRGASKPESKGLGSGTAGAGAGGGICAIRCMRACSRNEPPAGTFGGARGAAGAAARELCFFGIAEAAGFGAADFGARSGPGAARFGAGAEIGGSTSGDGVARFGAGAELGGSTSAGARLEDGTARFGAGCELCGLTSALRRRCGSQIDSRARSFSQIPCSLGLGI